MVDVAQLVEPRIVIPAVAGSSPVVHPTSCRVGVLFVLKGLGPLAQLVEQLTLNQLVVGSIPTRPTILPSSAEGTWAQFSLAAHHVKNVYSLAFPPVENSAGGLNNLSITPTLELGRLRTAIWMSCELIDMSEYSLHQGARGGRIVKGNIVSDGVEIV
jgi:hypothetical protein